MELEAFVLREISKAANASLRSLISGALPLGGGEGERDPRATARAVFGPDPAALGLDKSASDREPEARASGRAGRVGPPEAVEHSPERFGCDSFAGVLDADAHLLACRFDQDGDRAVGGRVRSEERRVGKECR